MDREAEEKLLRAVERATKNYTRPKDGEALYYLGVARRALGKTHEAEDALNRASWDESRRAASFYVLAEIAGRAGDYAQALDRLDRARAADALNPRTRVLEAALRRKLGDMDKARAAAAEALALDPLDFWGWNETALLRGASGAEEGKAVIKRLDVLMRDAPAAYLELAADYARVGLWDEGLEVLERLIALNRKGSSDFPLVHYWLAWFLHQKGDDARAEASLKAAAAAPADYGFPFQLEMADILRWARTVNPADARAPYYLGNLLFDLQPEAALASWERAATLDPKFPTAHRNLGLAYARIRNDLARSVKEYEAAVANAPEDAKLYEELDRMYEAAGAPPAKRLVFLEKKPQGFDQKGRCLDPGDQASGPDGPIRPGYRDHREPPLSRLGRRRRDPRNLRRGPSASRREIPRSRKMARGPARFRHRSDLSRKSGNCGAGRGEAVRPRSRISPGWPMKD